MLENAVPLTVASDIWRAILANRRGRRTPQLVAIDVANIDDFAGAIADRVGRSNLIPVTGQPGTKAAMTLAFSSDLRRP